MVEVVSRPRWAREWEGEQILETLRSEGRTEDVAVFTKFLEVGWKGLHGGNVAFTDDSEESKRRNRENEYIPVSRICGEFGWLSVDISWMPRQLFEGLCTWSEEGELWNGAGTPTSQEEEK